MLQIKRLNGAKNGLFYQAADRHCLLFLNSPCNLHEMYTREIILFSPGISSSGYAQANLQLKSQTKYYSSVRAITNVGNVLESVSDGFTVDTTAPVVILDR